MVRGLRFRGRKIQVGASGRDVLQTPPSVSGSILLEQVTQAKRPRTIPLVTWPRGLMQIEIDGVDAIGEI